MGLYVCDTFLADLRNHGDTGFAKRALSKILAGNGSFRRANDDHRFDGIDDAWIRVISRGNTAWRAIYIRRGDDVFLYRAGEHSVEDNLTAPASTLRFQPIHGLVSEEQTVSSSQSFSVSTEPARDRFLQNTRGKLLRNFLLGRRLIPHKEIILISPFISLSAFGRTHRFGQVLDSLMEEGTEVILITRPPGSIEQLQPFIELETRGIKLSFHDRLHAKLYIFEVAADASTRGGMADVTNVAMLGSANLTECGMGFGEQSLEELCYELPLTAYEQAIEFASQVIHGSEDLRMTRAKLSRLERRK